MRVARFPDVAQRLTAGAITAAATHTTGHSAALTGPLRALLAAHAMMPTATMPHPDTAVKRPRRFHGVANEREVSMARTCSAWGSGVGVR